MKHGQVPKLNIWMLLDIRNGFENWLCDRPDWEKILVFSLEICQYEDLKHVEIRCLGCKAASLGEWLPTFRRNLPPSSPMVQGPSIQDHIPQKRNPRLHLQIRVSRTFCVHSLHTCQSQLSHCSTQWKVVLKRSKHVEVKLSLYMTRWHILLKLCRHSMGLSRLTPFTVRAGKNSPLTTE